MNDLTLISAEDLFFQPLEKPRMLIDGLLSNGLAVLAGDSKIGKSWLVLWLCLQISKGKAVWGIPTKQTDVVYLALEDRDWRVQQRMQELTDTVPENLFFAFSCDRIGVGLEAQIEAILLANPSTGVIFIDTLQMVRDNASVRGNAYAQDYKDLSALKKIADDHGICIFVVHHTRKMRDDGNIFNDISGSNGIVGVADTIMILRKDERFGNSASLSITGRDIEERKLKMQMNGVMWEVLEDLSVDDIQQEQIPDFIIKVRDYLFEHNEFHGTASALLAALGEKELKPNLASMYLARHAQSFLAPYGIIYNYHRLPGARLISLKLSEDVAVDDDDADNEDYEEGACEDEECCEEGGDDDYEEDDYAEGLDDDDDDDDLLSAE